MHATECVCGEIAADTIREIGFCVLTEPYLQHYPQAPNQPSTLGGPLEGERRATCSCLSVAFADHCAGFWSDSRSSQSQLSTLNRIRIAAL